MDYCDDNPPPPRQDPHLQSRTPSIAPHKKPLTKNKEGSKNSSAALNILSG